MRFRLTLWYSSLLLVFGLAFVIALNVAARVSPPEATPFPGISGEAQVGPAAEPGRAMDTRPPSVDADTLFNDAEEQLYRQNLDTLRTWSLVAVVGLVVTSAAGGYVVSGFLLGPVREISRVASEIGATNLSRRINHQGVDDELKDLADTFDSMIGRLEYAFNSQQQFVQDASHELRTPLTAIRTNIEVTELDPHATVNDYRELSELVKTQTDRLARLADDLLLLTGPASSVELQPVPVESIVSEVVRQLAGLASRRGASVEVFSQPGVVAFAEEDLLFRCVSNLVDNALKYSGDGSAVTISTRQEANLVEIEIEDTGPGIPSDALAHVFERFYRVDRGRSRREGGSGLGLAIAKELVQKMGGDVSVSSQPGRGTKFKIKLSTPPPEDLSSSDGSQPIVGRVVQPF